MFLCILCGPVAVPYPGPGCNRSFDGLTILYRSSFQKRKFGTSDEEINHIKTQVHLSSI